MKFKPDLSKFKISDYLKVTILGLALAAAANAMHMLILPLRIQTLVNSTQKSTYLGLMTFAGLVIAILLQPIAGAVSDRSGFRWGRRRPYILLGILTGVIFLLAIGIADDYITVFLFWCLVQAGFNIALGPYQALIPDRIPEGKWGFVSGLKSLLEIGGGVALLRVIANLISTYSPETGSNNDWLWLSLGILSAALLVMLIITLITVNEKPPSGGSKLRWSTLIADSFKLDFSANSNFILFLVSRLLFIFSLTAMQSFAFYFFQDVTGLPDPAAITADLITAVGAAMLIIVIPAGHYSDRIGRRPILMGSGLIAAAGVVVILFFPEYPLVLCGGALVGLATGAFFATDWALAVDLVSRQESARYLGLTNLATAGGAALARLVGPAVDYFNNYSSNLGYTVLLGGCCLFFILSSLFIVMLKVNK